MLLPEITLDRTPVDAEWDTYVMRHPQATFFHLTGWQHVVEKTFAYRSFSCAARCHGQITGVLPLFLVRHLPFGYALVSVPLAVYGGICADDVGSRDVLLSYAQVTCPTVTGALSGVTVQVVKTGMTPPLAPSDRLREGET